ncbi:hypothetical protein [Burkholderia multivorans]|uniref:hypothetical protein n=1 Tax=Burkholderia multivorans TaxID=87883 RepID=UPI001C243DF8|nr:hypothetical protein [Burkholderia multivorans]MBU9165135.1 hypothetical protein [Burkholderia multivorans]
MGNWKENLGGRIVRIAMVNPKSFLVGAATAAVMIISFIGSSPHWIPLPGGPFIWISASAREALENEANNWRSRASELEKVRDGLIEENRLLEAKLATNFDRRQACERLDREISSKEAQISALNRARENALHRAAPVSVPLDGSHVDYASTRTPEIDRYDADINLLNSSLPALRDRAAQNCI